VLLSTLSNWIIEFEKWAPKLQCVVYRGCPQKRKAMKPMVLEGKYNVLLTTFEYITKDRAVLGKVRETEMREKEKGEKVEKEKGERCGMRTHRPCRCRGSTWSSTRAIA
jgi:SNF2 family DNA or RNA helicase